MRERYKLPVIEELAAPKLQDVLYCQAVARSGRERERDELPVIEELAAPELQDILYCQAVAGCRRVVKRIHALAIDNKLQKSLIPSVPEVLSIYLSNRYIKIDNRYNSGVPIIISKTYIPYILLSNSVCCQRANCTVYSKSLDPIHKVLFEMGQDFLDNSI